MKVYCPLCYKKIEPTDDGICPSCCENILPDWARKKSDIIVVKDKQLLPDVCFRCGKQSEKHIYIKKTFSTLSKLPIIGVILSFLVTIFTPFIAILLLSDKGVHIRLNTKLPICSECKKITRSVEPVAIEYEYNQMQFRVHENLRNEFIKVCYKYINYDDYKSYKEVK